MAARLMASFPKLERRALEHERDAFDRRFPVGTRLRLKPDCVGKYGSTTEVEVSGEAGILAGQLLVPVLRIAHVWTNDLDLGGAL